MAVYVDDMRAPFGRMIMCHMVADSLDELHAMAAKIGIQRKWYQGPPAGKWAHYDIALSMRAKAVEAGAVEIKWRESPGIARRCVAATTDQAWDASAERMTAASGVVPDRPINQRATSIDDL
jgi:hypothetical protein